MYQASPWGGGSGDEAKMELVLTTQRQFQIPEVLIRLSTLLRYIAQRQFQILELLIRLSTLLRYIAQHQFQIPELLIRLSTLLRYIAQRQFQSLKLSTLPEQETNTMLQCAHQWIEVSFSGMLSSSFPTVTQLD